MAMEQLDFSKSEELQTRDGRNVRIFCTDAAAPYTVIGAIEDRDGWHAQCWRSSGYFRVVGESPLDLIRKPQRVRGWLSLYEQSLVGVRLYPTQELAKKDSTVDCIGQIYIDAEIKT